MKKSGVRKRSRKSTSDVSEGNVEIADGKFTFNNGDTYEGGYELNRDKRTLVKQDQGVYITDDFNIYEGKWLDDGYSPTGMHVRYNNEAQYKGGINEKGEMCGKGRYIFPDGSSVEATWLENKPASNVVFKEPLGFSWVVERLSKDAIGFSPGNHFWTELCEEQSDDIVESSTESA